ncbi:MAG: prolipoprotein diacylglyceryl transferase [Planctomycetota bacterium]
MSVLAEIAYPRIDPILVELGDLKIRWYGVSYVLAFVFAYLVLRMLAKRGRLPVAVDRVADVLFWGVLGVFIGGRIGYVLFYMIPFGEFEWGKVIRVWDGGMSFHGGLLGVVLAYVLWARKARIPFGDLGDGLALATAPGLLTVRIANFINAELFGTVTDMPWGMRFPDYRQGPENWEALGKPMLPGVRHPSQLYEAFAEGLLLYLVLRWLMLRKGLGGGRIAGVFLIGYGLIRFALEFVRLPDEQLGRYVFDLLTQGQLLSSVMIVLGVVTLVVCQKRGSKPGHYDPATGERLPAEGAAA